MSSTGTSVRPLPGTWTDRLTWSVLVGLGVVFGIAWAVSGARPVDATMYWNTDLAHLYGQIWGEGAESFYVYPPPFAQVVAVIRLIGWPVFVAMWTVMLFAATAYAGRIWALFLVLLGIGLFPWFNFDHPFRSPLLYPLIGNVQPLLAAAVVAGFRYPALWTTIILTKIGPGVGIVWFAFRGEWRSLGIAVGATLAIAATSYVIAPHLWWEFLAFAWRNSGSPSPIGVVPIGFPLRLAMSIALMFWGARTNRRWTVPIAAGWSAIALYDWTFVEFWMAAPVLWSMDRSWRKASDSRPAGA